MKKGMSHDKMAPKSMKMPMKGSTGGSSTKMGTPEQAKKNCKK